jgi:hypothetical protein
LVNPAAFSRTPSSRRWSIPWLEASIAAWLTPAPAAAASSFCKVIASGVVWLEGAAQAPSIPVVPMLIASCPSAAQIWRVKVATRSCRSSR